MVIEKDTELTVLTNDAMSAIADYMEPVDLVRFERINNQWMDLSADYRQTRRSLSIPKSITQNSFAFVKFIYKFGSGLKNVEFPDLNHLSGSELEAVASAMTNIEDLGLIMEDQLPKLVEFLSAFSRNQCKLRRLNYAMDINDTSLEQFIPFKQNFQTVFRKCRALSEFGLIMKLYDEIREVLKSNRISLAHQLLQVTLVNIILSLMARMESITLSADAFLVIRSHINGYKPNGRLTNFRIQYYDGNADYSDSKTMSNVSVLLVADILFILY